jgi:hypothetical protein
MKPTKPVEKSGVVVTAKKKGTPSELVYTLKLTKERQWR